MDKWYTYFLWCIVVGMLAGIGIAQHSYASILAEGFASYCSFHYRDIAVRG